MNENITASQFWDMVKDGLPFPAAARIYENAPSSHPSWKAVMGGSVLSMMSAAHSRENGVQTPLNTQNEALVAMHAALHDFPMFWVDRSLLESLLRTDPPEDLNLSAIQWPYPALTFILPKGTLGHQSEGDCSWLMIGKIGGSHRCPLTGHTISVKNATVCAFTVPWDVPNPSTWNYGIPNEADFPAFRPFPPDLGPGTVDDYTSGTPVQHTRSALTSDDETLAQNTLQLGLRLLLTLTARPEFLGEAAAGRPAKSKAGTPREYATPRWMGKDYSIRVDSSSPDASGGSVRLHWRRGHYRNQAHGEGRALRKILWIEPYLAGKPN